jgi:hypothetical protein
MTSWAKRSSAMGSGGQWPKTVVENDGSLLGMVTSVDTEPLYI